jgi:serine/threonine-protein kinase
MTLKVGDLILNKEYCILEMLGHGAFGEVYRALDVQLNVERAVKSLRADAPGVGSTVFGQFRERFRQEAQLGARLDHPNVIKVYRFSEDEANQALYMVMELAVGVVVEGKRARSLRELLTIRGPLPVDESVRILLDACAGLATLHDTLRVVHRDVKPSNILLDAKGGAKIADLGVAQMPGLRRTVDTRLSDFSTLPHPGTAEYSSPEHPNGAQPLLPTADVYSLGCVAFEMLTGELWKTAQRKAHGPRDLRGDVPEWLDGIVARMLSRAPGETLDDAKDGSRRYVDSAAIGAALRAATSTPTSPPPLPIDPIGSSTSSGQPAPKPGFSRRAALIGAGGVGVLGLGWLALRGGGGQAAAPPIPAPTTTSPPTPTEQLPTSISEPTSTSAPTQSPTSTPSPTNTKRPAQAPTSTPVPTSTSRPATSTPAQNSVIRRVSPDRAILSLAQSVEMEFVRVPAGEFLMGSDRAKYSLTYDFELPQHKLNLPEYWIGKTEVTVAQFAVYVKATGAKTSASNDLATKANHPVVDVTWDDCIAFCLWAGKLGGGEMVLPSEAEWEKAARGNDGRFYPWGNDMPDNTRLNFNSLTTTPVGKYGARGQSPYGCDDMAGNVEEWTRSLEKSYPYSLSDGREDLASREHRVVRGGAFRDDARLVYSGIRNGYYPIDHVDILGFRVVLRSQFFG